MASQVDKVFEPILYSENVKKPDIAPVEFFSNTDATSSLESAALGFYGGFGENFLNSLADTFSKPILNAYSAKQGLDFLTPEQAKKEFGFSTKKYTSRLFYERLEQRKQNTKDYNAIVNQVSKGGLPNTPFILGNVAGILADPTMISFGFGVSNLVLNSARHGMYLKHLKSVGKSADIVKRSAKGAKITYAEYVKGTSKFKNVLGAISHSTFIPATIITETLTGVAIDYSMQYSEILRQSREDFDHKSVAMWGVGGAVLGGAFGVLGKRAILRDFTDVFGEDALKSGSKADAGFKNVDEVRSFSHQKGKPKPPQEITDIDLQYIDELEVERISSTVKEMSRNPVAFFASVGALTSLGLALTGDEEIKISRNPKNFEDVFALDTTVQNPKLPHGAFVRSLDDNDIFGQSTELTSKDLDYFSKFINTESEEFSQELDDVLNDAKEFYDEEYELISNIYKMGKNSISFLLDQGLENVSKAIRKIGKFDAFEAFSSQGEGVMRSLYQRESQAVGIMFSDRLQSWFNSTIVQGVIGSLYFDEFYQNFSLKYDRAVKFIRDSGKYVDFLQNDELNPRVFDVITEGEFMNFFGDAPETLEDDANIKNIVRRNDRSYSKQFLIKVDQSAELFNKGDFRSRAKQGLDDTVEYLNNLLDGDK